MRGSGHNDLLNQNRGTYLIPLATCIQQTIVTLNDKDLFSVFQDDNLFVVVVPETDSETLTLALEEFCPTVNVSIDASSDSLMYAMPAVTKINYAYVKIF